MKHRFAQPLLLVALTLFSTLVAAQSFTGTIVGTVRNSNGEVVG